MSERPEASRSSTSRGGENGGADMAATSDRSGGAGLRGSMRSVGGVALFTLLSRVTGLVRMNTQARFLGTADPADAFRIALLVPSLFRRLVGEGALPSVMVPVLSEYTREDGDRRALRLLGEKFYTLWTLLLVVVTVAGVGLAGWLLSVYGLYLRETEAGAPSWSPEKIELTIQLMRWLFAYLIFIGLSAVGQGILNSSGVFVLPSAAPLLYNLAFIAAGYLLADVFPGDEAPWAFVVGVLVGGLLQLLVLVPTLWRRGLRFRPRWPLDHPAVRRILRLLVPGTFGAGVYQVNVMVSMLIAMRIPLTGAVASLEFSARLMEFVIGVFVFALSTVGLTRLSRHVIDGDRAALAATISQLLRLTVFVTVPSTVGLLCLSTPVIEVLLEGGRFDRDSTELVSRAFYCHLPGLLFVGLGRVLVAVFYAHKEIWVPVKVGVVALAVNVTFCLWLSSTALEHAGIALASTISVVAQTALLMVLLQATRSLLVPRELALCLLRSLVAAAIMGGVCLALDNLLGRPSSRWLLAGFLALEIAAGATTYFLVAWALRAPELQWLIPWRRA